MKALFKVIWALRHSSPDMGNQRWVANTRCIFHLPVLWTWIAAGWSHHLFHPMNTPVLPLLQGRTHIFKIHARSMSVERDIRFELLARLCPNSTGKLNEFLYLNSSVCAPCPWQSVLSCLSLSLPGAEIRSVCTEAGMFAIRARRKIATEKDFLEAVNKVIKSYAKFSATPRYMTYNWSLGMLFLFPRNFLWNKNPSAVIHVLFLEDKNKWSVPRSRFVFIVSVLLQWSVGAAGKRS